MGGRLSRAAGLDPDFLQPIRAGRSAAGAAVCENVAGSSRTRRRMAQRGVRRAAALFAKIWRVSAHGERARSASRSRRNSARGGPATCCGAPRMPGFPPMRNSGPPLSPISSGARASPWKIPRPAPSPRPTCRCRNGGGFVTRRRARALPQRPWMNRLRPALRRHCRAQTRPSDSTTIFARCFVQWTATRCCLRSICGRRRTLPSHRQQILARLRAGTMPCDGAWPDEKIALFERWAVEPVVMPGRARE